MINRFSGLLKGHKTLQGYKAYVGITLIALCLISCSYVNKNSGTLPKKIKYDKIKFEPCAYSGSDYVCIKNSEAIKLVINFKQCQEQNKLLRELNGN
tara:strand:- start:11792 stop:12082 length:291 start_codon:yes stop_codon:yes gene_type:complete